jgi:cysteine desulfurase family protein (TIGR01976 family)
MTTDHSSRYDVAEIRKHFPSLQVVDQGRQSVFFDGPGGTQVPNEVIEAIAAYYRTSNANEGGAFATSRRNDEMVARAHAAYADFLNAETPDEIKFGANMTSLTFHISRSIGAVLAPGDEVIVTTLDHEANVSPWRLLAADRGLTVRTIDIRPEDGTLDLDDFDRSLTGRTKLVACGYASNALGTINPVGDLVRRAHAVGALTYIDAVHLAPHAPIDVRALDTDFLVCSAYKFYGPHLGVLYAKASVLDRLPVYKVRPAHDNVETGTQNFEGIAGAMAAVDYLAWVGDRFGSAFSAGSARLDGRRRSIATGLRAIRTYEMGLFRRLVDGLEAIPGLRLWGISDRERFDDRTPTAAVTFERVSPRAAAEALGERGFATWDGDFYAQALIERLDLLRSGGLLRIGLSHYNTPDEVDRLLAALHDVAAGASVGVVESRPA